MAEDTMTVIESPYFDKLSFERQIDRIKEAATKGQKIIDFASAHDADTLRAIDVVEHFLRKTHRLCYGGQAINVHLPTKHKFYNPQFNIPDYDFMTPDQDKDIEQLATYLRKVGFTEIAAKEGMHEGTIKIYVNFVPVADLTAIDPKLYDLLSQRGVVKDGISYMDANTLRMLMYLELGRPKGELDRWEKVYKRLMLLNRYAPAKRCPPSKERTERTGGGLTPKEVNHVMRHILEQKHVFAGGDLVGYYKNARHKTPTSGKWLLKSRRPLFFYSANPLEDARALRPFLMNTKVVRIQALGGDLIPNMILFLRGGVPSVVILEQTACHSYYDIPIRGQPTLRAATLDTLITLYFSMGLLKYKFMSLKGLECLAKELVEISFRARSKPDTFPFEFISLTCDGKQTSLPSLIRSKVRRIKTSKKRLEALLLSPGKRSTAVRQPSKRRRSTFKNKKRAQE